MIHNFFFFWKCAIFLDNVQKYCRGGQATDDSRCMHIAGWMPKAIDTQNV